MFRPHTRILRLRIPRRRTVLLPSRYLHEFSPVKNHIKSKPSLSDESIDTFTDNNTITSTDSENPDPLHSPAFHKWDQDFFLRRNAVPVAPQTHSAATLFPRPNLQLVNDNTFEPLGSFESICANNTGLVPGVGSFVEFTGPTAGFGVVIKSPECKFNKNYNKLTVLTLQNTIVQVYPLDVDMCLYKVLHPAWIEDLAVLENRYDDQYEPRLQLGAIAAHFLQTAQNTCHELAELGCFDLAYAQHHRVNEVVSISLAQIILSIPDHYLDPYNESYFHQSALVMACRLHLLDNPSKWLVQPSLQSNIVQGFSNQLPKVTYYFLNSLQNLDAIETVKSAEPERYQTFFADMLNQTTNPSLLDLSLRFNIWEDKKYLALLTVLKFCVIYPHESIHNMILKLPFVREYGVTPSSLFRLLQDLKIYDSEHLTDIYFSSNVLGEAKDHTVSTNLLQESETQKESRNSLNTFNDKFRHLRQKQYYNDHIIYGLPLNQGIDAHGQPSFLAVSREKINSRKDVINIHIPDVMTRLAPGSMLFEDILRYTKSIVNLSNGDMLSMLHQKVLRQFAFHNQNNNILSSTREVYQSNNTNKGSYRTTCMTISFEYKSYITDPFKDLPLKVNVSFDTIDTVRIKNVSWRQLQDVLEEKMSSLPFRLFYPRREIPNEADTQLDETDQHNINMIYGVVALHFRLRSRKNALVANPGLNVEPTDSSYIIKSHEISLLPAENQEKMDKAKLMLLETSLFAGELVSAFCQDQKIPVFSNVQTLIDNFVVGQAEPTSTEANDDVLISHNNALLPDYRASSYFHTLLAKDSKGFISTPALLAGRNYLSPAKLQISGHEEYTENVPLGFDHGLVNVIDVFNDAEAFLNQLQLLNHVQLQFALKSPRGYLDTANTFGYLKGLGYNVLGPMSSEVLKNQLSSLNNGTKRADFFGSKLKKYWTLKMLQQRLDFTTFECVVTSEAEPIDGFFTAKAYCTQLNIELDVMVVKDVAIGTVVVCDNVIYLDPPAGVCVLQQNTKWI